MKKKLKQISKALLLCSMLYFTSCVNDDFFEKQSLQNQSNYELKKISFSDLKTNRMAFEKLKETRLMKNPSLQHRGVFNEDYGVFIDTTNIILVKNGDKHSLTFQIVSDDENTNKVENLILKATDDGGYLAFIAEYNLTQQDLINLANGSALHTKTPSSISSVAMQGRFSV
jgi:hypothetical protein